MKLSYGLPPNARPCVCGHATKKHRQPVNHVPRARCYVQGCDCQRYEAMEAEPRPCVVLDIGICACGHSRALHALTTDGRLVCIKAEVEKPGRVTRHKGQGVVGGPQWSSLCGCEEYRAASQEVAA